MCAGESRGVYLYMPQVHIINHNTHKLRRVMQHYYYVTSYLYLIEYHILITRITSKVEWYSLDLF